MAIEKFVLANDHNLFSYLFQAVPPGAPDLDRLRTTAATPTFWVGLHTTASAPWPGARPPGGLVQLGRGPDGGLFAVQDEAGLLLLAGFGFDGPGEAWEELQQTVNPLRLHMEAMLKGQAQSQGIPLEAGVPLEWPSYGTPPERGPWLVLVPWLNLCAYPAEAEDVLEQARTIGLDLLAIYGPASV